MFGVLCYKKLTPCCFAFSGLQPWRMILFPMHQLAVEAVSNWLERPADRMENSDKKVRFLRFALFGIQNAREIFAHLETVCIYIKYFRIEHARATYNDSAICWDGPVSFRNL